MNAFVEVGAFETFHQFFRMNVTPTDLFFLRRTLQLH